MTAKDVIIDFLNYTFLVILVIFCITFFIIGDRFAIFTEFMKSLVPLAILGIFFLIKIRLSKQSYKKFTKENSLDDIIKYLSKLDKIKDTVVISFLPVFIIGSSYLAGRVDLINLLQALVTFCMMYFWHMILFRKENINKITYLTNFDKIKDEVVIFLLPILIIGLAILDGAVDFVEILQGVMAFLIVYYWHKILFRKEG